MILYFISKDHHITLVTQIKYLWGSPCDSFLCDCRSDADDIQNVYQGIVDVFVCHYKNTVFGQQEILRY